MQLSLCHLHYVVNRVHEWFMRCTSFCQQSAWMMDEMGIILSTECMVDWWDYHGNMSNILWIRVLSGRQDQDRSLYWQSAVWLTRSRPLTVLTECRVADKIKTAHCIDRLIVLTECYVADEIITSRAGKRVRVGNTDAEGRMVMADVLCKFKEMVKQISLSATSLPLSLSLTLSLSPSSVSVWLTVSLSLSLLPPSFPYFQEEPLWVCELISSCLSLDC